VGGAQKRSALLAGAGVSIRNRGLGFAVHLADGGSVLRLRICTLCYHSLASECFDFALIRSRFSMLRC